MPITSLRVIYSPLEEERFQGATERRVRFQAASILPEMKSIFGVVGYLVARLSLPNFESHLI